MISYIFSNNKWTNVGFIVYIVLTNFFIFIFIFNFYLFFLFSNKKKQINKINKLIKKKQNRILTREEKLSFLLSRIKKESENSKSLYQKLIGRERLFFYQINNINNKEKEIDKKINKISTIKKNIITIAKNTLKLNEEELNNKIIDSLKTDFLIDLEEYKNELIEESKEELKKNTTNIICNALEKFSSELIFEKTTTSIKINKKSIISKIIGKEGRNINFFRKITETDLIICYLEKDSEQSILQISSFNSLKRELALQTLNELIDSEKISPSKIEEIYLKKTEEINEIIINVGKEAIKELNLYNFNDEMIYLIGKMKYRTSYGQNVLQHSIEVSKIAGLIAAELKLNVSIAKRAGLLHDIGKVIEDENDELTHVENGVKIANKYKENPIIINAIASHHGDTLVDNVYSFIVIAADKLSAARVGARGLQTEAYIKKMQSIESIVNGYEEVKKGYAFQAGREIWIIVDSDKVSNSEVLELISKIKRELKKKVIIQGKAIINVIREKKFVSVLNTNSKEMSENKEMESEIIF